MQVSFNWIKSLVPGLTLSAEELAELLTRRSFNTEIAGQISIDPNVTVVKITKIEPHPNADKLRLATITDGSKEIRVVCGAPNIKEEDVVPYAPPGSIVKDEAGEDFKISVAKIRGVDSSGMLASPRELGLGEEHGGIYILPPDTKPGAKLADFIPADVIFEAEVLPDRAHDCLSHFGIAQEVARLLKLELLEPAMAAWPGEKLQNFKLDINVSEVSRYAGFKLADMKIGPSPLWLQARLWAMGSRPKNNIVDITNYVMWEMGNPTHAFDCKKLAGDNIGVRFAREGEKLETLDEETRELSPEILVITNDDKPVAIAGIIGGAPTAIEDDSQELLLEVANFHAYTVQRGAAKLRVATESSARFSKGLSPALVERTACRALSLLSELAGARVRGVAEYYPRAAQAPEIIFDPAKVSKIAGVPVAASQVEEILKQMECQVMEKSKAWRVTPPIERLDLAGEHDLVEEAIRVFGLENIPAKAVSGTKPELLPSNVLWRENLRDMLVAFGLAESINYSWEDDNVLRLLDSSFDAGVRLAISNPVSPNQKYLRTQLLPRLLQNALNNKSEFRKKFSGLPAGLFEIGMVFERGEGGRAAGVLEKEHAAAVLVGQNAVEAAASLADKICELFGVPPRTGLVKMETLQASTPLTKKIGLPVAMLEFDLDLLRSKASGSPSATSDWRETHEPKKYQAPSKYPPVYRDLAILVAPEVSIEHVQGIIEREGHDLVADVDLFDVYDNIQDRESKLAEPVKNLAFHIAYQSNTHTLTSQEVDELHLKIVKALREELGAKLR